MKTFVVPVVLYLLPGLPLAAQNTEFGRIRGSAENIDRRCLIQRAAIRRFLKCCGGYVIRDQRRAGPSL